MKQNNPQFKDIMFQKYAGSIKEQEQDIET